jgi:hypothetical protein
MQRRLLAGNHSVSVGKLHDFRINGLRTTLGLISQKGRLADAIRYALSSSSTTTPARGFRHRATADARGLAGVQRSLNARSA